VALVANECLSGQYRSENFCTVEFEIKIYRLPAKENGPCFVSHFLLVLQNVLKNGFSLSQNGQDHFSMQNINFLMPMPPFGT
jgi:hypothetical protein